jgi:bacteriorhodopsin
MASNLGYVGIATEFAHDGFAADVLRQIWYVRYIDWVITTPLLLLELLLASGLTLSDILTVLFFDELMIITGLVGSLVVSSYKWGECYRFGKNLAKNRSHKYLLIKSGYFVGGCVAEFYVLYVLFGPARTSASVIGKKYASSLTTSAGILSILWILYPVGEWSRFHSMTWAHSSQLGVLQMDPATSAPTQRWSCE